MAQHEIDVRVPSEIWVGNTDLEVAVYGDGRLVGQLHISRGTVDWVPSKGRSRYRLSEEDRAELIEAVRNNRVAVEDVSRDNFRLFGLEKILSDVRREGLPRRSAAAAETSLSRGHRRG